jgi:hypothetical protein
VTFTYGDPSASRMEAIRFLVGDVDPSQPLLADEEHNYLIGLWGEFTDYRVAAYAAEAIAAKLAREVDVSADGQSLGTNSLQDKYVALSLRLREQDTATFPGDIFMGGVDPGEGVFPGTLPPAFGTGMHDNPAAGNQDYGDWQAQDSLNGEDWKVKWGMSDVP